SSPALDAMVVRFRGPLQLARERRDLDRTLGARLEITKLDVPARELVADDHREVGAVARCRLELLAELALSELGAGGEAGSAQLRGDPESCDRIGRVAADDDRQRRG